MKKLVKYLEQQSDSIAFLVLKKRAGSFVPATFHKLRVQIKKLHFLFDLIKFCSTGFKKKKHYRLFKLIFQQAGKVRELQVEETALKSYLNKSALKVANQYCS